MRLENTWQEIRDIPSSRITPDPSDSQLHDGASSLQFTSLIFYRVQVRGLNGHSRSLVLCSVTHFCVFFWGLCLDYCTVGRSKHGHTYSTYIHTYIYFFLHFLFNKFSIKVIIKITLKNCLEKYLYYVSYYFALQKKKCFFNNLTNYNIYRTKRQKKNMEKKARGGKKRKIYAYKINV